MAVETEISALIAVIKDLPLKEALALLATKKCFKFAGDGCEKLKKIIRDKYNESKYAFVPDKEEARVLKQFSTNPNYGNIRLLVPQYPYIDLLRTGLLIDFYNKRDGPSDRERVSSIKNQICRRPNSGYLLKIVKLPGTPFFSTIIQQIYDLKRLNYSANQINEAFSELIDLWESSSKFFDRADKKNDISSFCDDQISDCKPFFFVLGMRSVGDKVEKVIEAMNAKKSFQERGYDYKITKSSEGNQPRVEIRFTRIAW